MKTLLILFLAIVMAYFMLNGVVALYQDSQEKEESYVVEREIIKASELYNPTSEKTHIKPGTYYCDIVDEEQICYREYKKYFDN